MHRIWFERSLPPALTHLTDGIVVLGPATATPGMPLVDLPRAEAVIASVRVRYDGALMDRAPALRVISRTGIGLDNISIPDATARGIAVCYTPDAPTVSTAEHTIALMFAVAKQLKRWEYSLGGRNRNIGDYQGLELHGLTLGLVGLGRIGSRVATIAQALGMYVVAFDPYRSADEAAKLGVELTATLESVLHRADIVSLHVPLTSETRQLMNAERFAEMKPGAILINAARGGLVDEAALLDAVTSGHLAGAGLDVLDPEPPHPDNPLLYQENVIVTPHIAGATAACQARLWETAIAQALQVLRGERPSHLANPDVWPLIEGRRSGG